MHHFLALVLALFTQAGYAEEGKEENPYKVPLMTELNQSEPHVELESAVHHLEGGALPFWLELPANICTGTGAVCAGVIGSGATTFVLDKHLPTLLWSQDLFIFGAILPIATLAALYPVHIPLRLAIYRVFRRSLNNKWIPAARDVYERAAQKFLEKQEPIPPKLLKRMAAVDETYGTHCAEKFSLFSRY